MLKKDEVITFKVDANLAEALHHIPNRSEFIRRTLLAAIENVCPMCNGTGHLSPRQKEHWESFARNHSFHECDSCHERHLVCQRQSKETQCNDH